MYDAESTGLPTGSPPKLAYSVAEAAYMSGLSRSSLYLAIRSGALEVKKCGRRTLVLHERLVDFLRAL
jgi:Helix-turn-helix domain